MKKASKNCNFSPLCINAVHDLSWLLQILCVCDCMRLDEGDEENNKSKFYHKVDNEREIIWVIKLNNGMAIVDDIVCTARKWNRTVRFPTHLYLCVYVLCTI